MKKLILLNLLLFIGISLNSQSFSLKGNVVDSLESPIEVATVILLQAVDSVMSGFSVTNPKGKFEISDIATGEYLLNITYLGYVDYYIKLKIDADKDLGSIILKPASTELANVTVSATHIPIKIQNDTVVYNANAFKTQAHDNVEALLKKLPGIEVEADGTIKAHGEEVKNVLVDGKEFFGKDPTIATKNLPANILDNVEVFDQKSDMAQFSGIDDGQREKTINLVLKEGKKAGYFGNATAGGGSAGSDLSARYDAKFNINRFTKSTQLSGIGMLNNTNKQGFSFGDYISFMGGLGSLMSGGRGRGNSDNVGINIADGLGDGIVKTGAGGLNFNQDFSKKVKLTSSYFYNAINNILDQESSRQNLLSTGGFNTEQAALLKNINHSHTVNATLRAELDSTQNLIIHMNGGWNDGSSSNTSQTFNYTENGTLQSDGANNNQSSGNQYNIGVNTTYMKRLQKKGRFLSANATVNVRNNDQNADLMSLNQFYSAQSTRVQDILQDQAQSNFQKDYNLKLSYTEPLGKRRYLEMNVSRQNYNNDYEKVFYDLFPGQLPDELLNANLSNAYSRDFSHNNVGLNMKFNSANSSLTIGSELQHSELNGDLMPFNPLIETGPINRSYLNVLPSLFWNKQFGATRSLSLRYNTSVNEPSLEQLQPIVDNSDPLNIYIGNPELNPSYRHRLNLNYNSFSQFSNVGFFSGMSAFYNKNQIVNTKTIDEFFVQTTRPINTSYAFNSSLYFNLSAPLKFVRHRFSVGNNLSYSDNLLYINNIENRTDRITNRVTLRLDNWSKDIFDISYGFNWSLNNTAYSESKDLNQSFSNWSYFADLGIEMGKGWTMATDFSRNTYSQEAFGDQLSINRLNASISKVFLTSKKLRVEIAAFDLFNQNQNINRSSSLNYIEDSRIISLGRYVMLNIGYSFSGFGNENIWQGGGGRGRGRR